MNAPPSVKGKIRLPQPHQGQIAVRRAAQRWNWLCAGRRWRKTSIAMAISVETACQGRSVIWGAPTFDQVRVGWEETRRAVSGLGEFNVSRMSCEFPTGGRILFRSLDNPDNVRGRTADGIVIDEAATVMPAAWYEVLRPMLSDTGGWLWAIGTPVGSVGNWFYEEHTRAATLPDSAAWQAPTLGCEITLEGLVRKPHPLENPFMPFEEMKALFEMLPEEKFRQEMMAEFRRNEGAVFRNVDPCLTANPQVNPAEHFSHRVVMGVDWGQKNDFTALSVFCANCSTELFLDRFRQIDWDFQRQRLRAAFERFRCREALCETNSIGSPNLEALIKEGLLVRGFTTTSSSKTPLIQALALALEKEEARWLPEETARRELLAYEAKVNHETGRITYACPQNMNDDTVIARALVWKCVREPREFKVSVFRR